VPNPFYDTGLRLLSDYWSLVDKDPAMSRGYLDGYVPADLMGHPKIGPVVGRLFNHIHGATDPVSGLVPYYTDSWVFNYACRMGGRQFAHFCKYAAELLGLLPDHPYIRDWAHEVADATIAAFDFEREPGRPMGLYGVADVKTGEPVSPLIRAQHYAACVRGMATLGARLSEPRYTAWARQKCDWLWANRLAAGVGKPRLSLLYDYYCVHSPVAGDQGSVGTDGLEAHRHLYEAWAATADKVYADRCLMLAIEWYDRAWSREYGHFRSKVNQDGSPAPLTLYASAKWITLWVLRVAYAISRHPIWRDRWVFAWDRLRGLGKDGLFPETVSQGIAYNGTEPAGAPLLEAALDMADLNADGALRRAIEYGDVLLAAGPARWGNTGQAGRAFWRLGRLMEGRAAA